MKHIKYLFLALVAVVLLPSCADEGPEMVDTLECSATTISVTPISATIKITLNASEKYGISNVQAYDESGQEYWGDYNDNNTYTFNNLTPSTTYRLAVSVSVRSDDSDYYGYDYEFSITPKNGTFTTKAEGDYSEIATCTTEYTGITNTSAAFLVKFHNQNLMVDGSTSECIRVKYGTTPDLKGEDTREIVYGNYYYDYENYVNGGAIDNLERSIAISLINLNENTKYYFSITGNFRYTPNGYYEQAIENVPLTIDNNSFTTTSGEQSLGYFNGYAYSTYDTSTYLSITCPKSVNFAPASVGYNIDVVCSTTPDFANVQTFSFPSENGYLSQSCNLELNGLTPGTTYYYYIIASFATEVATETKNVVVIYQNVKMEGADGCGTFTTEPETIYY